jgi:hypothetical protein
MLIKVDKKACYYSLSVIAAATENNDDGKDNDPGAVIVEKMAKTVVIHRYVPPKNVCSVALHIFIICTRGGT